MLQTDVLVRMKDFMLGALINAFALLAFDSRQEISGAYTFDRRKAHLVNVATRLGIRVHRKWIIDLADQPSDEISPSPAWLHASNEAARKGWKLIVDFPAGYPVLERLEERLRDQGVKVLALETLERCLESLGAQDVDLALNRRGRGGVQTQRAVARSRRKLGAMRAPHEGAAQAHAQASGVRVQAFSQWIEQARKAGAHTPLEIADWLNGQGVRTARNIEWTRANVQRMLNKIEFQDMSNEFERFDFKEESPTVADPEVLNSAKASAIKELYSVSDGDNLVPERRSVGPPPPGGSLPLDDASMAQGLAGPKEPLSPAAAISLPNDSVEPGDQPHAAQEQNDSPELFTEDQWRELNNLEVEEEGRLPLTEIELKIVATIDEAVKSGE